MTAAVRSIEPRDALRALAALALAYFAVVLTAGMVRSGGRIAPAAPELALSGENLALVRGSGTRAGSDWVVQVPDATGSALLAARVAPFAAADYPEIRWRVDASDLAAPALFLAWQTRAEPGRTFVKALERIDPGSARVDLDGDDGWSGTIAGVGLLMRGGFAGPVVVHGGELRSGSLAAAWAEMLAQWRRPTPFGGNTITFPFDEERYDALPLPLASALAVVVAALALALRARRRRERLDVRLLAVLLLVAWLVLDARWQWNFATDAIASAARFAGKSDDAKHRAATDAELYVLMQEVGRSIPPSAARVIFLADSPPLRARASYFLLPHNVFHELDAAAHAPAPETLRAGDYVVLFLFEGLAYDRARGALVWPDGRARAVAAVRAPAEGPIVVRVQ